MRKSRQIRTQVVPTFAFVVDGDTEIWYLQMLKRNERSLRLNIRPEIPNKKSIEDQYALVTDLSKREYSKVFWIVDLDTIIRESLVAPKGSKSPIQRFIELRELLNRDCESVVVIVNNPCLEFWFLLHFEKTARYFDTCTRAEYALRRHMSDYQKSRVYFTKPDNDIYIKLRSRLGAAIGNSNALGRFDVGDYEKAICEMNHLFESNGVREHYENSLKA